MGAFNVRLLKVAMPATATAVGCSTVPLPDVSVAVTVEVLLTMVLPPESWMSTTGCWVSAAPAEAVAEGCVAMPSLAAAPAATTV